jgi:hypothetical protein
VERAPGPEMGSKDIIRYRKRQGFNSVAILACFPNWDDDGLPPRIVDEEGVVIRKARPAPSGSAKRMRNEGVRPASVRQPRFYERRAFVALSVRTCERRCGLLRPLVRRANR